MFFEYPYLYLAMCQFVTNAQYGIFFDIGYT